MTCSAKQTTTTSTKTTTSTTTTTTGTTTSPDLYCYVCDSTTTVKHITFVDKIVKIMSI